MSVTKSFRPMYRRGFFSKAGLALLGLASVGSATLQPSPANAGTNISASAQKKCATCRYWGGVRQLSKDGQTITADGKGWCNNSESPAYFKQTKPTQGAPVWVKWDAIG